MQDLLDGLQGFAVNRFDGPTDVSTALINRPVKKLAHVNTSHLALHVCQRAFI